MIYHAYFNDTLIIADGYYYVFMLCQLFAFLLGIFTVFFLKFLLSVLD